MNTLVYFYYFLLNLVGINVLPTIIIYNGLEWYNEIMYDDNDWNVHYVRFVHKSETEVSFEVVGDGRYSVFLKMVCLLWKNRKDIQFISEIH